MQATATRAPLAVWLAALPPLFAWPLRLVLVVLFLVPVLPLWALLFVARAVLVLVGVLVVPLALPWRTDHADTARPFTEAKGVWRLVTLPAWAWLWSNARDGALGDRRGWWHKNTPGGWGAYDVRSMFWWLVIRNPVGNARYLVPFALDVTRCRAWWFGQESVEDDPGAGGFRFLVAWSGVCVWFGLYWVKEYRAPAWLLRPARALARRWPRWCAWLWLWLEEPRALVVQLGNKAEPSDWLEDYQGDPSRAWKGTTFEVNPWKAIN